jgi:hypothetical protein
MLEEAGYRAGSGPFSDVGGTSAAQSEESRSQQRMSNGCFVQAFSPWRVDPVYLTLRTEASSSMP